MSYLLKSLFILTVLTQINLNNCIECDDLLIVNLCNSVQSNCDDCLKIHPCCHWCYEEGIRIQCGTMKNLENCPMHYMKVNADSQIISKNEKNFTHFTRDSPDKVVQISPTEFNISLRLGTPINITVRYSPAKDYPLDLYYLLDVSYSMASHIQTFQNLTDPLKDKLQNLTSNTKVAYGSFMDKMGMPFYLMDDYSYENPCYQMKSKCIQGYLFRHHLNFTTELDKFTKSVFASNYTANVDNADGALDAIMQVLTCDVGWNTISRKLIVVPTQSILHIAGDGVLLGAVRKNDKCLLDRESYVNQIIYDYPSLDEIYLKLSDKKVTLIFATENSEIFSYYKRLSVDSPLSEYMSVKQLETKDYNSILDLIGSSYNQLTGQVRFHVNPADIDYINVEYYANCSGIWEKKSSCKDVQIGNIYEFNIQLTLTDTPPITSQQLVLQEKHLSNEEIIINLNFAGYCDKCDNFNHNLTCENGGKLICDKCRCEENWEGKTCNQECPKERRSCKLQDDHKICEGNGACICGQCKCEPEYVGTYCQYRCPYNWKTRKHCNGNGICSTENGTCMCSSSYDGPECECSLNTDNCIMSSSLSICNDNGICECNKCSCRSGYRGKYCEYSLSSKENKICNDFRPYVTQSLITHEGEGDDVQLVDNITVFLLYKKPENVKTVNLDDKAITNCSFQYQYQNNFCQVKFFYNNTDHVKFKINVFSKECVFTALAASFTVVSFVGIGIFLLGSIILSVYLFRKRAHERKEFKKFDQGLKDLHLQMSKSSNTCNPLYKDPETTYINPQYSKEKLS